MELYQLLGAGLSICDRIWRHIMAASGNPTKPTFSVTVPRTGPEAPKPSKK